MNQSNQPMNFNPGPAPTKKNNTTLIIIIVAVVILCCCCIAAVVAWQYGDQILKSLQGSAGTSTLLQML
jgi:flagellar basal body-associated protein FliL